MDIPHSLVAPHKVQPWLTICDGEDLGTNVNWTL